MEIKSIADHQKKSFGEILRKYMTYSWYFEKWYEKAILILLGVLGLWKIFELLI